MLPKRLLVSFYRELWHQPRLPSIKFLSVNITLASDNIQGYPVHESSFNLYFRSLIDIIMQSLAIDVQAIFYIDRLLYMQSTICTNSVVHRLKEKIYFAVCLGLYLEKTYVQIQPITLIFQKCILLILGYVFSPLFNYTFSLCVPKYRSWHTFSNLGLCILSPCV